MNSCFLKNVSAVYGMVIPQLRPKKTLSEGSLSQQHASVWPEISHTSPAYCASMMYFLTCYLLNNSNLRRTSCILTVLTQLWKTEWQNRKTHFFFLNCQRWVWFGIFLCKDVPPRWSVIVRSYRFKLKLPGLLTDSLGLWAGWSGSRALCFGLSRELECCLISRSKSHYKVAQWTSQSSLKRKQRSHTGVLPVSVTDEGHVQI